MRTLITREQAVAIVGEAVIAELDRDNCDFTGVQLDDSSVVEFRASSQVDDFKGEDCNVSVYYYPDAEAVAAADDLGTIDWVAAGYEIN